jgi:hypothetical protein
MSMMPAEKPAAVSVAAPAASGAESCAKIATGVNTSAMSAMSFMVLVFLADFDSIAVDGSRL